jgi:aminocarboxymuconate-semialdehyde decarboxylase
VIDVHAHVVLEGVMGCAGPYGPELSAGEDGRPRFRVGDYVLGGVRYRESPFMDVGLRLALMDRLGIEFQVLSPNPLTYFGHIEAPFAARFARWHNDELAALVAAHPDRLAGFAQLPWQAPELAEAELRRAAGLGLRGAYIGSDYGIDADDARLDPVYAAFAELDLPLFVHPAPWGIDGPLYDRRIRRFDLDLSLGFLYEETLTVATMIFGGVLDRHPGLDVCFSHGGGASPLMAGRLQHAGQHRPWGSAEVDFVAGLRRLWFDNHIHDAEGLALVEAKVGRDRLVVGTNMAGWDAPTEAADIAYLADYDTNARRLLRLP